MPVLYETPSNLLTIIAYALMAVLLLAVIAVVVFDGSFYTAVMFGFSFALCLLSLPSLHRVAEERVMEPNRIIADSALANKYGATVVSPGGQQQGAHTLNTITGPSDQPINDTALNVQGLGDVSCTIIPNDRPTNMLSVCNGTQPPVITQ